MTSLENVVTVSSNELQAQLGSPFKLESNEFWNGYSEKVFYTDGDSETCLNALHLELDSYAWDDYTLYYVKDLKTYYLIED